MKRSPLYLILPALLAPSAASASSATWMTQVVGVSQWHEHIATAILVAVCLSVAAFLVGRKVQADTATGNYIPSEKASIRNFFEVGVEVLIGMMRDFFGNDYKRFVPIIGALAFYILFCNLIGLVPGFLPPTSDVNTTASMALPVFVLTHIYGLKAHGAWNYFKHFCGPLWVLAWIMLPIELIGHFARPMSLSLRLFGNLTGDHEVVGQFSNLIPIGVPVPFMAFGIMVSFIQAFVFILLSMIYFSLAIAHDEEDGEHH